MKYCRSPLLILVGCLITCCRVTGQVYNYAHYTTRDGLAGETLYTITQDAQGFMWFATETGLSRFDGQKFKNFTVADGLPANEVFGFYEDSQQRLWIKSYSNEPCYYFKGRMHNKSNTPELKSLVMTSQLHAILETRQGAIIFTDETGEMAVLEKSGMVRKYGKGQFQIELSDVLAGEGFTSLMLRLPGKLHAALDSYYTTNSYFANNTVVKDRAVFILISKEPLQNRESWLWDNGNGRHKRIVRPERLQALPVDGDLQLESYRKGGAGIFNLKTGKQTATFLPEFVVNGIYQDRDGNIWFGTKWNGLFKLSNKDIFSLTFNADNTSPAVQFVHADKGNIFAGDDNGNFWQITTPITKPHQVPYGYTKKQLAETVGWLQQNAAGRCINYNGSDFLHLNYLGISQGVKTLFLSGDTLLFAASNGVFITTPGMPSMLQRIHEGRATCAIKFNGCYYVGTLHGLKVYNSVGQLLSTPLSNRISFMTPGQEGVLWVSTYDNGVYALMDNKIVTTINTRNSMLSSNLSRCIFYKDNNIWVGTDKGICRIGLTDTSYKVAALYNQNNGLSSDIINTIFVNDGMVYAGTSAGLNIFSDRVATTDTAVNLTFTRISIADTNIDLDQPLILPHKDNRISFDFSAISFSSNKVTYQYRLLGLSNQWQKTAEQTLSFLSLPSGKYRLQIQAFSPSGGRSTVIEKAFDVKQSVLEYWWIRLLLALLAGAIIFLIVYLRIRKIRRTEAEKREMGRRVIELEQMALRAQMNPHFIFNCLNSVQHYILKKDAAGANFYLSQFAGLVRQTLENASKLLITLQEEITYLKHYIELERLQVNYPFDYSINISPAIITSGLLVPNMIIQPFIENALKHGLGKKATGGYLSIDIRKDAGLLHWTITDNGPGINHAKGMGQPAHRSRGISLIEKRISTLNSMRPDLPEIKFQIHDLHESGSQGTRVEIAIPIIINSPTNS